MTLPVKYHAGLSLGTVRIFTLTWSSIPSSGMEGPTLTLTMGILIMFPSQELQVLIINPCLETILDNVSSHRAMEDRTIRRKAYCHRTIRCNHFAVRNFAVWIFCRKDILP